ncbi:hypothetical protein [Rhodococcoides fascians]|uniref:hypothetical protein n=1 Tax=Rhodococcoides fascians TaxID=1828 RepID=UPI00055A1AEF|nr:hypothetical protein [Rhodococcus fascians]
MTTTTKTSWVPAPRVLEGDWQHITQALENLPDGTIVRPSPEAAADRECAAFIAVQGFTGRTWQGTGAHGTFATQYLAKHCAPLTVVSA